MPLAPPRPCAVCGRLACAAHRRQPWRKVAQAPPARVRGRRLQALRAELFRAHPFCQYCQTQVATIRDHILPLAEGGRDEAPNIQALCQACSDTKTQAEAARGVRRSVGR